MELIIIALVFFILSRLLLSPEIKGKFGEGIVSRELNKLQIDNCIVINNILIKSKNRSSQIDHVVICPFGIIVVETKFFKGWIFGSEESIKWTQVIYNKKFKIFNPIIQNIGHIKTLKYNLPQYSHIPYYSIIVLAGSCEFKNFDDVTTPVIYPDDLIETVNSFKGKNVLSEKDILDLANTLNSISSNDKKSIKGHAENVRNKQLKFDAAINLGKCPICGGTLVDRTGKYGKFQGCKNYPKCKFTK